MAAILQTTFSNTWWQCLNFVQNSTHMYWTGSFDHTAALVRVMAWYTQAPSLNLYQWWPSSLIRYGVIRPQWVNSWSSWHGQLFYQLCKVHWLLMNFTRQIQARSIWYINHENILTFFQISCWNVLFARVKQRILQSSVDMFLISIMKYTWKWCWIIFLETD